MSRLVTIYGGSGFVGRYIARRLAREGWRVRVAVRRPNEAVFVRPYGVVGQVEPVFCNIRDDVSVAQVMAGADAVVNCVGILNESGANGFDAVQAEGAARIARLSAEQGVARLVHLSALGADADSASDYARTKAEGEAAVQEHRPDAVILRPSVIFGPEGKNILPAALLYKKNILALRGSFRPATKVNMDMIKKGMDYFIKEKRVERDNMVVLFDFNFSFKD